MTFSSSERTGLLFLRVWIEPGHATKALRARLTGTVGDSGREVSIATAATVDDAVDSMRSWLEDFIASSARNDSRKQPHNTPASALVTPLGQGRGDGVDLRSQGGGPMSIETESRPSGSDIETPGRAFGIDAERRGQVRSGRIGKQ
jgi:hypothetical protein